MRHLPFHNLFCLGACFAAPSLAASGQGVSVLWARPGATGRVAVDRGTLDTLRAPGGTVTQDSFDFSTTASPRLELVISPSAATASLPVLVTVEVAPRPFTFRLGDVTSACPIFVPEEGVIITAASDPRTYAEVVANIRERAGRTKLQHIAAAPEATFAAAVATGSEVKVETWLGVSRDMRLFRIDERLESIRPKFAGHDVPLPETPKQPATLSFHLGRGWGARNNIVRHLDGQVLPILRGQIDDEAIQYDLTMFVSLECSPLTPQNLRGTDYLVADAHGHGHMFTPAQAEAERKLHDAELDPPEEVVLYARAVATNRGQTPHYALFRTAVPSLATQVSPKLPPWSFDAAQGLSRFTSGRVFAVSKFNGRPLPAEETSVLLLPGESAVLEFFVPHRPISAERALALARQSFDTRLAEARAFWRGKLDSAAQWQIPEPRIQQMSQAGLLHLDLITYGREPHGTLLPAIGLYTAIGSESSPIIQFMDSMGWHDTAARALDFFLQKQHEDGFIQNFNGYMLETGAVLWSLGEHYRYTRNDAWLRRVHPHLTKACNYLIAWRERNLLPELRGKGYGLLDGKTADPEDPYRSFMLNGYAYLGLARAAEMLRPSAPEESARYHAVAQALKADIRTALDESLARSPLVPLGDGTWMRAAPPWTGYRGPVMLHADGGSWFTHAAMTARDSLLGPLYLVFQEVIGPHEPLAAELLQTHSELMTRDNVVFSQPYYSRHPWLHLQRSETKAFLQAWYATVAAIADRSTYTFTEHFFPASPHKTHEEAWFLMETRWMLYLENGDTLRLLTGIPRAYLQPGANIAVDKAASYFGPLSFNVSVSADGQEIKAVVACPGARRPHTLELRIPHPSGRPPVQVAGGTWVNDSETVRVADFTGQTEVVMRY